jgi:acyl-CoA reductase-like NAD-dependent aldehyde dehydrogenase
MFSKFIARRNFSVQVFNKAGVGYTVPDKLIINGQHVSSRSGTTFDLINPSTEQVITQIASAGKEDVDDAVASCVAAQKDWKKVTPLQRAQIMNRFADRIDQHADELITLECEDMGKTYNEATFDMTFCSATIRYYAGLASTSIKGNSL